MAIISTSPLSLTVYGKYWISKAFYSLYYQKNEPPTIYAHLCDFSSMEATSKPYHLGEEQYLKLNDMISQGLVSIPSQSAYEPFSLELTENNWSIALDGSDYEVTSRNLLFASKDEAWDTVTHLVLTLGDNNIFAYVELTAPLTLAAYTEYFLNVSIKYKDAAGSTGLFSEGSRIILQNFFYALDRYEHIKSLTDYYKKTFYVALFDTAPSQTDKIGDLETEPDISLNSPGYNRVELPIDSWQIILKPGATYCISKIMSKQVIFENRGAVSEINYKYSSISRGISKSWIPVSYAVLIYKDYNGTEYPIDYSALTGAPITLAVGERIKLTYAFK